MYIKNAIISGINDATGYSPMFEPREGKEYFIVNDTVTTVYLNVNIIKHLELIGSHVEEDRKSSVVRNIIKIYIEALKPYLEEG